MVSWKLPLIFMSFINFTLSQLVSPCPNIFKYEVKPNEPDRWYGTAIVSADQDLTGVWFRVLLDAPSIQLGNWFGEVVTRDGNLGYLIRSPEYNLKAKTPLEIKFYVRYNPANPIPKIVQLRLNAVVKCSGGVVTTTKAPMQLYTNKPETETLNVAANAPISNNPPTVTPRPETDDFYHSDFFNLFNHQGSTTILEEAVCGTVINPPKPLITNGLPTKDGDFPWHAALYHSKGIDLTYTCGASLVSLNHLVTVAHCVTTERGTSTINPDNLVVYLGKFYLALWNTPGLQSRHTQRIFVHPKYNPHMYANDVAVIKLSKPATLTNYVRPVCLWEGNNQLENIVNKIGLVVGWGYDQTGRITEQLTKAYMPIVSQETCLFSLPDFYPRFTSNTTFCAGFKNGTSVCNGDSGGGLVLPKPGSDTNNPIYQLRGLVSISVALQSAKLGLKCDSKHYAVFTDAAKHMDFILAALKS